MLGIIGAMKQEVEEVKGAMKDCQVEHIAGMEFYHGELMGKEAVVVQSGVGKVNGAICAQILVDRYKVGALVNTGIAGSLRAEINIGDVVLSGDALQHDVDAAPFGYGPGQIPGMDLLAFPGDPRLIRLAQECCQKANPDIRTFVGRVVSGDQFIWSKEKKAWLAEVFGGYCTEMEGAAIAQAAYRNQVPFLVIRAISDKADDSASMDYGAFEELAIRRSVNLILELAARYQVEGR